MKDAKRGGLAVGGPADLVLVDGDPRGDVQALTRVRQTWVAEIGLRPLFGSQPLKTAAEKFGVSLQTGSLLVGDVREEQSVDDLDRARLQDFYDELERFRAVFAKAQALVAPMIGQDAGRLEAMGKAIRKLYGPAVEPLMAHVDEVLGHAKRMVAPLPENPLQRAFERRSGGDRRKADRALLGPSFRAPAGVTTKPMVESVPLPAPDRRFDDANLPTVRTQALRSREIPVAAPRNGTNGAQAAEDDSPARAAIRGFAQSNAAEPRPPRPPTVAQTAVPNVRREVPRPAPESDIRITYEDPGGWGVL
jgi:hypothetical protein